MINTLIPMLSIFFYTDSQNELDCLSNNCRLGLFLDKLQTRGPSFKLKKRGYVCATQWHCFET